MRLHWLGKGRGGSTAATGPVPYAPLLESVTPSSGQIAMVWQAPTQLFGGAAISGGPVSYYRVRLGPTAASVEVGGSYTDTNTTTNTNYTFTDVESGTPYVSVSAVNASGESEASIPYQVTVP